MMDQDMMTTSHDTWVAGVNEKWPQRAAIKDGRRTSIYDEGLQCLLGTWVTINFEQSNQKESMATIEEYSQYRPSSRAG